MLRTHLMVGKNFFFFLIGFDESIGTSDWWKGDTWSDNYREVSHLLLEKKNKCVSLDDRSYNFFRKKLINYIYI